MSMLLAAEMAPMKASAPTSGWPLLRASSSTWLSGFPTGKRTVPLQSSGSTGRLSSSKKSGKAHAATRSARPSSDSVNAMWNCRGRRKAAAKESSRSVNQGPPCTGA